MKNSEKILKLLEKHSEASPKTLSQILGISDRAVYKQLNKLLNEKKITKIGTPPHVFYKLLKEESFINESYLVREPDNQVIEQNFLYITPLGEYLEGSKGFIRWCKDRNLVAHIQSEKYINLITKVDNQKKDGVIHAKAKLKKTLNEVVLKDIFYIDFYALPQFGKTKLGQLLLYAKQSQDKKRIKYISDLIKPQVNNLIKKYSIDAVGFIPPTIKREVQIIKELEKNLALTPTKVKLIKLKTDIIVPQKSLSKKEDRVQNARNTIVLDENRKFKNILLIDDAVGSGASLNETAKKLKNRNLAQNIYGLAITGSYKGFEVISEV